MREKSRRMQPVARFTEHQEQDAARALGDAQQMLQAQEARLRDLRHYREEYARQFQTTGMDGISARQMHDFRSFLVTLDEVISQHEQTIEQLKLDLEEKKRQWLAARNRTKAIDTVIERHGSSGGTLRVKVYAGKNGTADVRVEDNGTGIAPENMEKIFSPFFTTKPVGKGSGLGLSVCYGIVDKLGGTMAVESRQGEGTVFLLRFPGAEAGIKPVKSESRQIQPLPPSGI